MVVGLVRETLCDLVFTGQASPSRPTYLVACTHTQHTHSHTHTHTTNHTHTYTHKDRSVSESASDTLIKKDEDSPVNFDGVGDERQVSGIVDGKEGKMRPDKEEKKKAGDWAF